MALPNIRMSRRNGCPSRCQERGVGGCERIVMEISSYLISVSRPNIAATAKLLPLCTDLHRKRTRYDHEAFFDNGKNPAHPSRTTKTPRSASSSDIAAPSHHRFWGNDSRCRPQP